jgi:sugar O-acyltransferase (sialic acid O-acetyltransferase NeuD family)
MGQKPLIIIGGGGHTTVLIGMLKQLGAPIKGIITADPSLVGEEIHGVNVLGLEDGFAMTPAEVTLVNGVGNAASRNGPNLATRATIYQRYRAKGFDFLPVISTGAILQPDITLGEGVQVMPGAVVQPGAMLGENTIINTRASVDHDVVLSPHAHIAPGAVLCGHVVVGEQTHIGAGAVVIQGITIGANVVIGAGAIITRDVADDAVVLPAR